MSTILKYPNFITYLVSICYTSRLDGVYLNAMEVLELDGKRYVKASKAARHAGYTTDYVGQLCRSGKVDAHLIGRSWYVDADQLGTHRVEKKRNARIKARKQAREAIKLAVQEKTEQENKTHEKRFLAHAATFEPDESALIPEVRKLAIEQDVPKPQKVTASATQEREEPYELENAGEKVLMEGSLTIVDLDKEGMLVANQEETILKPVITSQKPKKKGKKTVHTTKQSREKTPHIATSERVFAKKTFEEKLAEQAKKEGSEAPLTSETREEGPSLSGEIAVTPVIQRTEVVRVRFLPMVGSSVVISVLFVALGTMMEVTWVYSTEGNDSDSAIVESIYGVHPENITANIYFK